MKMALIPKLLIGLIVGVIIGFWGSDWVISITETGRVLLGGLIKFFIPFIIIAFVAAGIADFREKVGKMLGFTVGIAYLDTILAISLASAAAYFIIPGIAGDINTGKEAAEIASPFMEIEISPVMDVLRALILAFVLGIGSTWDKSTTIRNAILEFRNIIMSCINKLILPILPFFISTVFVQLTAKGEVFSNIPIFAGMFALVLTMQLLWLTVEYSVAGFIFRQNPIAMIRKMIPAYITGIGTMSSAVT